jgi:ferredoxin
MALRVLGSCFGCGACESACPSAAISQADSFAIVYVVDPLLCNDCLDCVRVCPVDALVPDPGWAVCLGRGCPLASHRYRGWECSQGLDRCPTCGSMMWRPPDGEWACSACRSATGIRVARCPKTEQARRAELTRSDPVPPAGRLR